MARPKGTKKAREPITKEDYEYLLQRVQHDKTLIRATKLKLFRAFTLLYHGGFRINEIGRFNKLLLARVIKMRYQILTKTKNNLTYKKNFTRASVDALAAMDLRDVEEYLFYKNGSKNKAMSVGGLTDLVNRHLKNYLSELHTTHSFRSGYATRVVEASNGNIETARKNLGHTNGATTIRYITTTEKQDKENLERAFA